METAVIVKVAVSAAPYSIDKPYDYLVPEPWLEAALPGARVTVPFGRGNRTSEGLILARGEGEKIPGLKPLTAVLDPEPVLDADGIALALWLRGRYFCTVFEAARTLLPAGLWFRLREIWQLTEPVSEEGLSPAARAVLEALRAAGGRAEQETLEAACGSGAGNLLRALEKEGAVVHETDARRRAGDRMRFMAGLAADAGEALDQLAHRRAPVRRAVVELLSASGPIPAADVCYFTGAAMSTLRAMERAGLVTLTAEEELRVPTDTAAPEPPAVLTAEQAAAYAAICALADTGRPEAVLLQGVTGSGKTLVYLHLVAEALERGRTALVLVPEIVLTPQMMRRFSARFGDAVAMIHSALRVTERYDQWKRIRRGEVKVVLGTRSAVFAPLKNLGLVILDEEQESGYQSENAPRYHARDVAKYLCGRDKAVLVLGSATPSVETAWAAEQGVYHRELTERYNRRPLPEVVIADLRQEIRNGNSGSIGAVLRRELAENLDRGEQSILFLNRRGSSRMLLCGECGEVPQCPRCSVPLTYHSANGRLMCHHCGHSERSPERCRCAEVLPRGQRNSEGGGGAAAAVSRDGGPAAGRGHRRLRPRAHPAEVPGGPGPHFAGHPNGGQGPGLPRRDVGGGAGGGPEPVRGQLPRRRADLQPADPGGGPGGPGRQPGPGGHPDLRAGKRRDPLRRPAGLRGLLPGRDPDAAAAPLSAICGYLHLHRLRPRGGRGIRAGRRVRQAWTGCAPRRDMAEPEVLSPRRHRW